MKGMFSQMWSDDQGAIISVEMILIIGVLIFGIIPGLVALRNSVNAAFGTIGNTITKIVPSFTYSGWAFFGTPSGSTIAVVQGLQVDGGSAAQLTAEQVAPPTTNPVLVIPPAP